MKGIIEASCWPRQSSLLWRHKVRIKKYMKRQEQRCQQWWTRDSIFIAKQSRPKCLQSFLMNLVEPLQIQRVLCRGYVNQYFYRSEGSFYFLRLLGSYDVLGADDRQMLGSVFIWLDSRQHPPAERNGGKTTLTRSVWLPIGVPECLELCVIEHSILVLDCLRLCVPTVWNNREGVFQRKLYMRERYDYTSERLGVRPSLNPLDYWSVCCLSSTFWICILDLWCLGYVPRQYPLNDDIREPYFLWGLSDWCIFRSLKPPIKRLPWCHCIFWS